VGEVVDDAIIDVENVVRRLRLNREAGNPLSAFRVVIDASTRCARRSSTPPLIVILVFLPIFFLDGIAGSFFRPLASAYMLAILASLGVALTVTPALCYMLLPGGRGRERSPSRPAAAATVRGDSCRAVHAPRPRWGDRRA
jgi:Cu/Ag efflux pump CusA